MKTLSFLFAFVLLFSGICRAETPVVAWIRNYSPSAGGLAAHYVAVDTAGRIATTGVRLNPGLPVDLDMRTARYSSSGKLKWQSFTESIGIYIDYPTGLSFDRAGNVVIVGQVRSPADGFSQAMYTAKFAQRDGSFLWQNAYDNLGAANEDIARGVTVDRFNQIVVTGDSGRFNSGVTDCVTIKYNPNGFELWTVRSGTHSANSPDMGASPSAVATDNVGDVVIVGRTRLDDIYAAKYQNMTGALLWETSLSEPLDSLQSAFDVEVDSSQNAVYLCGEVRLNGNTSPSDGFVARLNKDTGATVWKKFLAGPNNGSDRLFRIAVDRDHNVIVAGKFFNGIDYDFYVAKLSKRNGSVIWKRQIDGPSKRDDELSGLALDPSGNPVLTGYCNGANGNFFAFTVKCSNANGATMWSERLGGRIATGLAIDKQGNIFVSGFGEGPNTTTVAFLLKYVMQP